MFCSPEYSVECIVYTIFSLSHFTPTHLPGPPDLRGASEKRVFQVPGILSNPQALLQGLKFGCNLNKIFNFSDRLQIEEAGEADLQKV